MPGYGHGNKNNFKGGSIKRTKASKAKKSNKSKKVKRGGGSCGRKRMNGGGSCGSYHVRSKAMKGAGAYHAKKMAGGFIRDGSVQNLMMRVSDKKKCKN